MKRRYVLLLVALVTVMLLGMPASPAFAAGKVLKAGEAWEVAKTTALKSLTIAEGASITAPRGRTVSMTVDGIATPVQAGTYNGKIVLRVK
jgi:hypothetical protein